MTAYVLLCDFTFGSYIRLALAEAGRRPEPPALRACADRTEFDAQVMGFLADHGHPRLVGAALSTRGWETHGVLHLPDEGMHLTRDNIRGLLGIQRLHIVNNFVARALAVPRLRPEELTQVCGGAAQDEQVKVVLGPHHGLGLAGLLPDGSGGWVAMPGEGGHSDLCWTHERERAVIEVLRGGGAHTSREAALSLNGLAAVWAALGRIDGVGGDDLDVERVIGRARAGEPRAAEAVRLCLGWLAAMASDAALIMGARGGIYLTGALLERLGDLFDAEAFTARYRDKGRLSGYVAEIPVFRAEAADMEMIGLATLFE